MITIDQIKKLREETQVSISECKKALAEANGDFQRAKELLKEWGKDLVKKKTERDARQGIIESYIHSNKKIGVMIELCCETDFVAKNPDFQRLAHELTLQIAATCPSEENSLLDQSWIKDETKTIKDLLDEYITRLGENIIIKRFIRYEI